MKIEVNGETTEVRGPTLAAVLEELGYGDGKVATALNASFVPSTARGEVVMNEGDRLEVVTPRQGG